MKSLVLNKIRTTRIKCIMKDMFTILNETLHHIIIVKFASDLNSVLFWPYWISRMLYSKNFLYAPLASFSINLTLFPWQVWGLFGATIVVSTIFLYWFTCAELRMGNRKWYVWRSSISDSFFLILELLAVGGTDPAEKPRSHTVRVLYATCLIGTVVITGKSAS